MLAADLRHPPASVALLVAVMLTSALPSCGESESTKARRAEAREAEAERAARMAGCRAWVAANAALLSRCQEPVIKQGFGSEAGFRTRLELLCASLDLPGVDWPARLMTDCPAAIAGLSCDEWHATERIPAACQARGTLPDGAPCAMDGQCAGGRCALDDEACGTCTRWGAEGDPCVSDSCGAGLACVGRVCARKGALGGACSYASPCQRHLRCERGVCIPEGGEGARCSADDECNPNEALLCHRSTCTRPIAGARCLPPPEDGRLVVCLGDDSCNTATGACDPPLPDGAPCAYQSRRCRWPATCTDGVCQAPKPVVCE